MVQMSNFLLQRTQRGQGLLILLQQYDPLHHIAVVVAPHTTHRRLKALAHRSNIADEDGNIIPLCHHDRFDILNGFQQANGTHVHVLRAQREVISAHVGVAVLDSIHDLRQSDVMRQQPRRVDNYLILARGSTKRGHVDNAGNLFNLPRDQPVLCRFQFVQGVAGPGENITINFTDGRRRRKRRLQIIRQAQCLQVIENFFAVMEVIAVEAEIQLHIA